MSDSVSIEGKEYISSKRAAELSGYKQDYIGQLSRAGQIDAQRIGGLWYVSMASLSAYKEKADEYKPEPPARDRTQSQDPDSFISFDGKDYVSAARASKITGYHQDYVGQLARSGKILSRQVGNRWYIQREELLAHKSEKDALLGAVQSASVGLVHSGASRKEHMQNLEADKEPFMTYMTDEGDLMPILREAPADPEPTVGQKWSGTAEESSEEEYSIPIRVDRNSFRRSISTRPQHVRGKKRSSGGLLYGTLAAAALTVVIVLTFGFVTLKQSASYTFNYRNGLNALGQNVFTASAVEAFQGVDDVLEQWLVPELSYKRTN